MKIASLFLLFVSILLFSCKKDPSTETVNNTISISGITVRDITGQITSVDNSDWVKEDNWPGFINDKFNFPDTLNYHWKNDSTTDFGAAAYPNPTNHEFQWNLHTSKPIIMKYIIVDEAGTVFTNGTMRVETGGSTIFMDLADDKFPKNKYYRIYYSILDSLKKSYYKGHGDIKKN